MMQFSPKLKKAMAEIKAVLENHDIAGVVVLHAPGYSEYLLKVDPSYSCASLASNQVRFNTHGLGRRRKQQVVTDTTNMIHHLGQTSGHMALKMMAMEDVLKTKFNIQHGKPGHTSQTELDN